MSRIFQRKRAYWHEALFVASDDGVRVIVWNHVGNVMMDVSIWLFDQCWKRGHFEDVAEEV